MTYLDNNATTRVSPEVLEAMLPYFGEVYFNPSSPVGAVYQADRPLFAARQQLGLLLNCEPDEITMTSGATEANNWVLQTVAHRAIRDAGKCHMVVSAIEHPSILEVVRFLGEFHPGVQIDYAPVTTDGVLDLGAFPALLKPDTAIVSIMLANNETGVIQPVAEAAKLVRSLSPIAIFHTDATQAVGKIPVDLGEELSDIDCLSLSAHKFHGPKGIGALFIRNRSSLDPWFHGGGQQRGRRAGTENPAAAAGLAAAAEALGGNKGILANGGITGKLRNELETSIASLNPAIRVLGQDAARLPNTSLILFPDLEGDMLVHALLEQQIVASTGSACSNGSDRPSHVVTAMGFDYSQAGNVLRFSLSHASTISEVKAVVDVFSILGILGLAE